MHPLHLMAQSRQRSATPSSVLGFLTCSLLACCFFLACSGEESPADGGAGSGGSSGIDPAGMGGSTSDTCPASGRGSVEVQISGLPAGVSADLSVTGPEEERRLDAATILPTLSAGSYTVSAARVADSDAIVRTLFEPTLTESEFCLKSGGSHVLRVDYAAIPTSHRLWTNTANGSSNLAAFSGSQLGTTAEAAPAAAISGGMGKDVAFDADGNLWTMGATLADPHLMRFPAAALGSSGAKEPDRSINIAGDACIPTLNAFAFDAHGSLWVAMCGRGVVALDAADLAHSGDVNARASVGSSSDANTDVAFDGAGNLWVANEQTVRRFDAIGLSSARDETADLVLHLLVAGDVRELSPYNLVFDASGDLWVLDYGGNLLARVARSSLAGSGEQILNSQVTLALPVNALLERPAFDESGGLWIALDQGRFGRLAPAQLGTSSGPGEPTLAETVISSSGMGYANRMAFFPAPAGLPLFHRFP